MQTREHSEQSTMAIGLVTSFIFDPSYENYFQLSLHLEILKKNSEAILKYLSSPMFSESVAPLIQHIKVLMLLVSRTDANHEQNANEAFELLCKLLQSDPNNSLLWTTLSCTLSKLDSLTQNMQQKLFALTNQQKQTPTQFKAFCCGQSIACDEKFAPAWSNLGAAFARGARLADLPQACREQHFKGKDNWTATQFQAFCCGQAIGCDEKLALAWSNLGATFAPGARLANLPQACREQHFKGKYNWTVWQLTAFCCGQAIACDEKFASAWQSLGVAFSKGASLADLPQACREQHFKEKDDWNAPQLQAFCAEKFTALKKPVNNPHSSATSSTETNSSAASSHKRKSDEASDEALENPSKKQKTTHSKPSSITRPTALHPQSSSSTSNTASSSSMSQVVTPTNPLPNPHTFYNPCLHPFQQQYPNALNTHSHAINSGHGYPLPPTRPQLLTPFMMSQHARFFQGRNTPTHNPQPEVQITGNGQIPPLDNLANQATLLPSLAKIKEEPAETQPSLVKIKEEPAETQPSLAKIKEEPAETQTANPDSQPHGYHPKKM